jgi:membrane protein required for colicin V production
MNWLDWVLLAIIAISAFMGMKVGLIRAALGFVAMIIGWIFAGQVSDKVGGIFDSSLSNDTIVTVTTYAVLMIAIISTGFITKIIKPIMAIFTLGLSSMVDKLGGLALGLLFGFAIVGVVIIAGARLTYDFDTSVLEDKLPGQVSDQLPKIDDVSEKLETALSESTIVETVVNVMDALPAGALGLAPSDFGTAMGILDFVIEHR